MTKVTKPPKSEDFWKSFYTDLSGWHTIIIFSITLFAFIFIAFLDKTHPYYLFSVIIYIIFGFIYLLAILKGYFKKNIANGFFRSWKAIDIWVHMLGGFTFYFIFIVWLQDTTEMTFWIIVFLGILFEVFEYIFEISNKLFNKKFKIKESYAKYISEPRSNITQDIIMNIVGTFLGYLIVITLNL